MCRLHQHLKNYIKALKKDANTTVFESILADFQRERERKKERERQRQRQRETETETERETERQTDRQTDRDRQTEREDKNFIYENERKNFLYKNGVSLPHEPLELSVAALQFKYKQLKAKWISITCDARGGSGLKETAEQNVKLKGKES